jgi:hypothetical protein
MAASPAPQQSDEGSVEDTTLASLPFEILALVHSRLFLADPSLRSCLALEATCKHLRSLFSSSTRFETVSVEAGQLATAQGSASFWSWIAAHGRRTGLLVLDNLELRHTTPTLCSHVGVLQAGAVAVRAAVVETLEPLLGLLNLAAINYNDPEPAATQSVSMEPLAGLPALEQVHIDNIITDLAPLCKMAALTTLSLCCPVEIRQLDGEP